MSEAITTPEQAQLSAQTMEKVLLGGDLSALNPQQRMEFYQAVCRSVGLNPLTKPFDYIKLNNKLTLYAKRDATDQLRQIHGVSITRLDKEVAEGAYVVTAYAKKADGREDSDVGAVNIKGLAGEALANAMMKAITKAKRRVTLSICGLGWLDETEVDAVPRTEVIVVAEDGEIIEQRGAPTETEPEPVKGITAVQGQRMKHWMNELVERQVFASLDGFTDHVLLICGKATAKALTHDQAEKYIALLKEAAEDAKEVGKTGLTVNDAVRIRDELNARLQEVFKDEKHAEATA